MTSALCNRHGWLTFGHDYQITPTPNGQRYACACGHTDYRDNEPMSDHEATRIREQRIARVQAMDNPSVKDVMAALDISQPGAEGVLREAKKRGTSRYQQIMSVWPVRA